MVPKGVPRFEPFAGLRYDLGRVTLDDVIAPPYDVIDEEDRDALEARSPYNAVRVELSRDEPGRDRYQVAQGLLQRWQEEGVLQREGRPVLYVVRMRFADEAGQPRHTTGVLGALELVEPASGGILPHERTMPKPKGDRLHLLRACRANLSPIWALSPTAGLTALLPVDRPADAAAVDELGVAHDLWVVTDPDELTAISAAVAAAPLVIADGHHRYETAMAFRDEMRKDRGAGGWDYLLTYVVELAADELSVRAIHRLLTGLPAGVTMPDAFAPWFEVGAATAVDERISARMEGEGALVLVTASGAWFLRPRPETDAAAEHALDSSRLDVALGGLPPHEVTYQHGWDHVLRAVQKGDAQAGVLLRPATVEQIADVGRGGQRMPPKTTFFHPKPRTGLVFRPLD